MSSLTLMGAGPEASGPAFVPTQIAGLLTWWDFSALGLSNGAAISSVTDGSGNGNTLTQATGANQPLFQTGIQNGRAMAQFNGTTMNMGSSLTATTKPVTVFSLIRPTDLTAARAFLGSSVNGGLELRLVTTTGVQSALESGTAVIGSATTGETVNVATSLGFTYDVSGNYAFYSNGSANGTGLTNLTFAASTVVVGASPSVSDFMAGYIGEMLIYNSVLSTANRQSVESYLRSRWGTP